MGVGARVNDSFTCDSRNINAWAFPHWESLHVTIQDLDVRSPPRPLPRRQEMNFDQTGSLGHYAQRRELFWGPMRNEVR